MGITSKNAHITTAHHAATRCPRPAHTHPSIHPPSTHPTAHLVLHVVDEGADGQRVLWLEHVGVGGVVHDDDLGQVPPQALKVLLAGKKARHARVCDHCGQVPPQVPKFLLAQGVKQGRQQLGTREACSGTQVVAAVHVQWEHCLPVCVAAHVRANAQAAGRPHRRRCTAGELLSC